MIRDRDGHIVRKLTSGYRTGVNRITWSGRLPDLGPARENRKPGDGIMAMPGNYTVSLHLHHNGESKVLVEPVRFELRSLQNTTLPAEDRQALVVFQWETAKFQRVFAGANALMRNTSDKLGAMKQAIMAIDGETSTWMDDIRAMEDKLEELRMKISGDRRASQLDIDTEPSISSRLYGMAYAMYNSTSAPTQTQRAQLAIAKAAFESVLAELTALAENEVKAMERKLEAAGAPYTPGRSLEK